MKIFLAKKRIPVLLVSSGWSREGAAMAGVAGGVRQNSNPFLMFFFVYFLSFVTENSNKTYRNGSSSDVSLIMSNLE